MNIQGERSHHSIDVSPAYFQALAIQHLMERVNLILKLTFEGAIADRRYCLSVINTR
ncbi:hypothetical protein [Anabaena lutea]|uniref:hypothetical protein n=1 Tax=Anabaena lutea TaxID=212350 RepID=UPI001683C5D3|nr:hypothetical protein [Anabaena lutea]